jgi:hypothetical protein
VKSQTVPVLFLVVLAVVLLRGMEWFSDDLARKSNPPAPPRKVVPSPPPTPAPTPTPRLRASESELRDLVSPDVLVQSKVIRVLADREIDDAWVGAVTRARPAAESERPWLECLKSRLPGKAGITRAIRALPSQEGVSEVACFVNVLADRIEESPDEIAEALVPMRLARAPRIWEPAARGLRKIEFERIPTNFARALDNPFLESRTVGLALDLDIDRLQPEFFDRFVLGDVKLRRSALDGLARQTSQGSAKYFARALLRGDRGTDLLSAAQARDSVDGAVSLTLAEVACDEGRGVTERATSLEHLGAWGSSTSLPVIQRCPPWPQELAAYGRGAMAALLRKR